MVDAVVYFRISDPTRCITAVADAHASTHLLAQTTLRTILGMHTLQQLLTERDKLTGSLMELLKSTTNNWGITVRSLKYYEKLTVASCADKSFLSGTSVPPQ